MVILSHYKPALCVAQNITLSIHITNSYLTFTDSISFFNVLKFSLLFGRKCILIDWVYYTVLAWRCPRPSSSKLSNVKPEGHPDVLVLVMMCCQMFRRLPLESQCQISLSVRKRHMPGPESASRCTDRWIVRLPLMSALINGKLFLLTCAEAAAAH